MSRNQGLEEAARFMEEFALQAENGNRPRPFVVSAVMICEAAARHFRSLKGPEPATESSPLYFGANRQR